MHCDIQNVLDRVFGGDDASSEQLERAVGAIMDGACSELEIASLLTALRTKGEAFDELVGAARAMRRRATRIVPERSGLLDTCGTGGDELHTFNISTAAAIVAAAAGVPVAKHGNRSVSSSSGSADVLESLGVGIQLDPQQVARCLDEVGIGFCFAPLLHEAMKHVAPVRKQLRFRTIFNLLGPLTNPAGAEYQLLGANRRETAEKLAWALSRLGTKRAIVVCGADQLDEVALWGETSAFVVSEGSVSETVWTCETFDLPECDAADLKVVSAEESAQTIQGVLDGQSGPARNIVVANVAAALVASERSETIGQAVSAAIEAIDSGKAKQMLQRLGEFTRSCPN